jgi:DNA replication protein DnaC
MNTQFTVEQLNTLKLHGMAKRYQAALALPSHQQEDAHSLIALLCQAEVEYRNHYRTERLLKNSRLRYHAILEEVICAPERGLTREMVLRLSDGMFIEKGENVLIGGLTGTGYVNYMIM